MPNTTQEMLYETFVAISAGAPSSANAMIDASEAVAGAAAKINAAAKVVTASKAEATAGDAGPLAIPSAALPLFNGSDLAAAKVPANAPAQPAESVTSSLLQTVFAAMPVTATVQNLASGQGGGGIGHVVESVASTVFKSGLGLVPLLGGLFGLFGGDDAPEAAPLVKYAMPPSIAFQGADTGSGIAFADYDQAGMPRAYGAASGPATTPAAAAPQITVNVQAMDARSFLDRSGDIAAAVRDAMLNMNSLNDVVSEL